MLGLTIAYLNNCENLVFSKNGNNYALVHGLFVMGYKWIDNFY